MMQTQNQPANGRVAPVAVNLDQFPDGVRQAVFPGVMGLQFLLEHFISQQALPYLIQETIQAQSATIDMISGATFTSIAFQQSLQSALLQARAW